MVVAHIFPDNPLHQVIAFIVTELANHGFSIEVNSTQLPIRSSTKDIVHTTMKHPHSKLWHITDIHLQLKQPTCSWAIQHQLNADYVAIVHARYGNTPISTLLNTVR
jgi:hypothetical protein